MGLVMISLFALVCIVLDGILINFMASGIKKLDIQVNEFN